ncbi:Kelch motif-containing protein [Paenibacillus tianmuensis]|uniref:Kelch motif-containing protein n=1 Tax=Paenibacillus tianmuensis TaxID=624147 RepID=A0A1G4R5N1_9BACL|nr:kelch repeat-containing protein [Paenibacillus tianmuensis]SCW52057.1 Kelch motif-containing protein [Paenibacillus tianmuensis]
MRKPCPVYKAVLLFALCCVFTASISLGTAFAEVVQAAKAPMHDGRAGFGLETIGDKLYAVGGENGSASGMLASVEEYDPQADRWTLKAGLPMPGVHLKTAVIDGLLYVIAGYDPNTKRYLPVQIYDPKTNKWSIKKEIICERYDPAIVVYDGRVYVIGGYDSWGVTQDTVEQFDPNTGDRRLIDRMPAPRFGHGAVILDDILYVAGGANNAYGTVKPLNTLLAFDFRKNAWTQEKPMLVSRMHPALTFVKGQLFVVGGGTEEQFAERYDPSADRWTPLKEPVYGNRNELEVAVLDKVLYLAGGYRQTYMTAVEAWDLSNQ